MPGLNTYLYIETFITTITDERTLFLHEEARLPPTVLSLIYQEEQG